MAKFINKKEQVFDLQLTPYAKYLMSIGKFKPTYYAFFDDNVLYDKNYASASVNEIQNNVDKRIKNETQYLESIVLFRDLEKTKAQNLDPSLDYFSRVDTKRMRTPDSNIYNFENAIGDAYLDGPAQTAPAWKVVALRSIISSSQFFDEKPVQSGSAASTRIPQINLESNFKLKIADNEFVFDQSGLRDLNSRTPVFIDNRVIELVTDDPIIYVEEVNTELLNDNFDIEVFEVMDANYGDDRKELRRLKFRNEETNIENGFMTSKNISSLDGSTSVTTGSVEYYFNFLTDFDVDERIACKGAEVFNKQSYYVDIDFDCEFVDTDAYYFDIYGSTTEPEVCQ